MIMLSRDRHCAVSTFARVLFLVLCVCQRRSSANSSPGDETILSSFDKPEDLRDVIGTPYILISESSLKRKVSGKLSLLDTSNNNAKIELWPPASGDSSIQSPFADPTCVPAATIAPHGIDIRQIGGNDWEVAVVNHYEYESIEWYRLAGTTLTTAGCTRNLGKGDIHNAVSYYTTDDDLRLGLTLWYERYYGILGQLEFIWSQLNPFPGGTAALKIVDYGGEAIVVRDNLNGANGVVYRDPTTIIVAESAEARILRIDPTTGAKSVLTKHRRVPDNLVRNFSDTDLIWATRIDSSFVQVALCNLLGIFCTLSFSAVEIDMTSGSTRDIYSSKLDGQATVALVKDDTLYVGNFQTSKLLVVAL